MYNKQIINHIKEQKNKMNELIEKEIKPIDKEEAKEDKYMVNQYYKNMKEGNIKKANEILKELEEKINEKRNNYKYINAEHVLVIILSIIGGLASLSYIISEFRKGTFSFRRRIPYDF